MDKNTSVFTTKKDHLGNMNVTILDKDRYWHRKFGSICLSLVYNKIV